LQFSRCINKTCPTGLKQCGLIKRGKSEAKECHLRHRDGHDVPVIKNARVVRDETGRIVGVVETVTDLSELADARLRAAEAAFRLGEVYRLSNLIGKSRAMREVFEAIRAAADSDAAVLIQGESGTGKELVAGAIHHGSARANKPLITVNCSALPESLLESELFGHVRGAFTGAARDRKGRFEEADGGTVFLDEVGELSPFIQVKLLRVLQEREIERVGESVRRRVDIRVLAATHQDLFGRVRQGLFREDLYYRLKVFPVHLPPLRERREDIPVLIDHFVDRLNRKTGKALSGFTESALRACLDHSWPGNVRELENAVAHGFVLCRTDRIDLGHLPREIRNPGPATTAAPAATPPTGRARARSLSAQTLTRLLEECHWNKAEAARRLGISRTAVWKYMLKWKIPLNPPGVE
ncbi:MAG TPA: sigma 54-interacting transcriptional regulator, partial [Desulfobacterales bacterium]|nr:sigma 54-interacting transcriptional regulator [Desulfobacterales bacterium]